MGKFINPFTDWGFKKIFGQEANKDILITFLNALLEGERAITNITFLDKEMLGEHEDDRSLIYDIFCETDTGENIIVEMQNKPQDFFIDRSIYYVSRSIVEQGQKGKWNYQITAVYGVFIMNFEDRAYLKPKLRTDMVLADRDTGETITNKQRYIYLQLPFFDKKEDECETLFERLIFVLKKMEVLDRMPFEKKNFVFEKLAEIAEVRNLTKDERIAYDTSLRKYRDTLSVINRNWNDGLNEGISIGEKKKAIDMARMLKQAGIDITIIANSSGLSKEEIAKL